MATAGDGLRGGTSLALYSPEVTVRRGKRPAPNVCDVHVEGVRAHGRPWASVPRSTPTLSREPLHAGPELPRVGRVGLDVTLGPPYTAERGIATLRRGKVPVEPSPSRPEVDLGGRASSRGRRALATALDGTTMSMKASSSVGGMSRRDEDGTYNALPSAHWSTKRRVAGGGESTRHYTTGLHLHNHRVHLTSPTATLPGGNIVFHGSSTTDAEGRWLDYSNRVLGGPFGHRGPRSYDWAADDSKEGDGRGVLRSVFGYTLARASMQPRHSPLPRSAVGSRRPSTAAIEERGDEAAAARPTMSPFRTLAAATASLDSPLSMRATRRASAASDRGELSELAFTRSVVAPPLDVPRVVGLAGSTGRTVTVASSGSARAQVYFPGPDGLPLAIGGGAIRIPEDVGTAMGGDGRDAGRRVGESGVPRPLTVVEAQAASGSLIGGGKQVRSLAGATYGWLDERTYISTSSETLAPRVVHNAGEGGPIPGSWVIGRGQVAPPSRYASVHKALRVHAGLHEGADQLPVSPVCHTDRPRAFTASVLNVREEEEGEGGEEEGVRHLVASPIRDVTAVWGSGVPDGPPSYPAGSVALPSAPLRDGYATSLPALRVGTPPGREQQPRSRTNDSPGVSAVLGWGTESPRSTSPPLRLPRASPLGHDEGSRSTSRRGSRTSPPTLLPPITPSAEFVPNFGPPSPSTGDSARVAPRGGVIGWRETRFHAMLDVERLPV
jgi:hypothetical protein